MPSTGRSQDLLKIHRADPWRDSALSLLRAWDQSLVGKLRPHKPHSADKKIFFLTENTNHFTEQESKRGEGFDYSEEDKVNPSSSISSHVITSGKRLKWLCLKALVCKME